MLYRERIALETYQYIEVEADTFDELKSKVAEVKVQYANRLFKDKAPTIHTPSLSQANTPKQFAEALDEPVCKDCNSPLAYREGITKSGKNAGKPWKGWFCPNGSKENRFEHVTVWVK